VEQAVKVKLEVWLALFFCLMGGTLGAQPAAVPVPSRLTPEEAVREAIENNLALLAERYNLTIAQARIVQAGLRPNPVFSAGPDYQDWLRRGFTAANSAGPPEIDMRTDFIFEGGGKRERRLEVARLARSVEELRLADAIRLLTYDVQSACVDVLLAQAGLELARENLKSLESLVEVNRARVDSGDLAKVELMRSVVAARQFENSVKQAELRLQVAQNRLRLLLGRKDSAEPLEVAGPLRRDADPVQLARVREQAFDLRPDLQALVKEQTRSQSDIRLQIAQGKIDYTISTLYHHQYGYSNGRAFGLQLTVPIPVFNRNQGEIERARQEQRQIEARIRALQASIGTEVGNAYQQYVTARSLLENIEANMLGPAREVRQTMEYSYRRGEASLVEFLDAQRAYNETVQSYNEALAEYARSLYLIDSVSGGKVRP
jgi:cobalt-zinc-cadmium efflux system outer membrane protein